MLLTSSSDVPADQAGGYSCTFTASVARDCPPDSLNLDPADKTLTFTATLSLNPTSIAGTTEWPDMPASLNLSDITVTWDPPECVGSLEIVEIVGTLGYVPPEDGNLEKEDDTHWHYTSYPEPLSELCAKSVKVRIGAMQGENELARKSIMVLPVHTFLTTGANTSFPMDYDYISWKYAAVLATTQGGFTPPVNFSTSKDVCCPWPFCSAYACTTCVPGYGYSVKFGTSTFSGSENQAASIIGHELVHTTGVTDECVTYQWEADHTFATGTTPCDTSYIQNVLQFLATKCP